MLGSKLVYGAFVGAILGFLALMGSIHDGKPLSESLGTIPGGIVLGIILVFWFTRNIDENGNEIEPMANSTDDEIRKLQRQLNDLLRDAAIREANGDIRMAQVVRGEAAVIESQLRRLGA